MNKKAQGLPLSFIVIAAIAALILVIVVAFTIGGLGGLFRQILAPAPIEVDTVRTACQASCDSLTTISSDIAFTGSKYCTKTYAIDVDGDGKINMNDTADPQEIELNCWDSPISVTCSTTYDTAGGATKYCKVEGDACSCS